MPEWSHVDTVTLTELPPFTVGTKLAVAFAANDQHIPCYARILRVTSIPASKEGGDVSSQEPKTQLACGVPWSEEGFIEEAIKRGHPANLFDGLSKCLSTAISNNALGSCEAIILRRAQWFKRWTPRAFELRAEEQTLHEKLPTYRQNILKGKRFLVLRDMLTEMNYPDSQIVRDMQDGWGILAAEFQPAILTVEDLGNHSRRSNQAIHHSTKSSGDDHVDRKLWKKTLAEVEKGWLKELASVPEDDGRLSRRFAVVQSEGKVRPTDNYTESQINDAVSITGKCTVDGVDTISALGVEVMKALRGAGRPTKLKGRSFDLKSAYRQLAVKESSLKSLASNSEKSFELLLGLLGLEFDRSGDKSDEMSEQVAALGVVFNLETTHEGVITVANTEKRKADIPEQISSVLADGRMTSAKAASFKGRLGFAEGQLFGRAIRRLVNELGQHALPPPARGRLLETGEYEVGTQFGWREDSPSQAETCGRKHWRSALSVHGCQLRL
eukprot:s57_g67.t1